jgi:hypothetical protein
MYYLWPEEATYTSYWEISEYFEFTIEGCPYTDILSDNLVDGQTFYHPRRTAATYTMNTAISTDPLCSYNDWEYMMSVVSSSSKNDLGITRTGN